MTTCFLTDANVAIPISRVLAKDFDGWKALQSGFVRNWLEARSVKGGVGEVVIVPAQDGSIEGVVYVDKEHASLWDYAVLPASLKAGAYALDASFDERAAHDVFLAWGLSAYRFDRYAKKEPLAAKLCQRGDVDLRHIQRQIEATQLVRDLITTPANDMGPEELAEAAQGLAQRFKAKCQIIVGEDLVKHNYPAVYTVGQGSARHPRLIDITWGSPDHPKVTLVGKGVCFDSGGLDIKPSSGMLYMKKDMGGAAHVLGLAQMIMDAALPVRLRVLIPAVENSISGTAYRPLDIIKMRSGKTVEVGNTDAEGRLVLADALYEADQEKPELIIDFATLTGAARIALGTEVGVLFANNQGVADGVLAMSATTHDPLWQLPLWEGYRSQLKSKVADLSSVGSGPYGGAIIAGLFLSEFLPNKTPWLHMDIMAWNSSDRPGRPEGGEAMGMRALYGYLAGRYQ